MAVLRPVFSWKCELPYLFSIIQFGSTREYMNFRLRGHDFFPGSCCILEQCAGLGNFMNGCFEPCVVVVMERGYFIHFGVKIPCGNTRGIRLDSKTKPLDSNSLGRTSPWRSTCSNSHSNAFNRILSSMRKLWFVFAVSECGRSRKLILD